MSKVLLMLAKAFDTKGYPDDKNPDHWRKINGSPVHLDANGHIDGGAGGKFKGKKFGESKKSSGSNYSRQETETEYRDMFSYKVYIDDEYKKKALNLIKEEMRDAEALRKEAMSIDVPWPGEEGREEKYKKRNDILRRREVIYHRLANGVMRLVWSSVSSEEIRAVMEAGLKEARARKYD